MDPIKKAVFASIFMIIVALIGAYIYWNNSHYAVYTIMIFGAGFYTCEFALVIDDLKKMQEKDTQ